MMGQSYKLTEPMSQTDRLGTVVLFGSGETSPSGRAIHQRLASELEPPIQAAVLETPAGFQPNTALVAGKVADFLRDCFRQLSPQVSVVPARRRDGHLSTSNPDVLAPMLEANYIFLGPGSPTYMARHMEGTLALEYMVGRHRQGASIALASAAAIAMGCCTLPVYEIFKAGLDPYWAPGLDFFGAFGLNLAIITHWNNKEGGAELDTSHCYMGKARMAGLRQMLPPATVIMGIDEHTGLVFDFQVQQCSIMGAGSVTILTPHSEEVYGRRAIFPFHKLGAYHPPPPVPGIGPPVKRRRETVEEPVVEPPPEVMELIQKREAARMARDWALADSLRQQIAALGFHLQDTRQGPRWRYAGSRERRPV